MSVNKIFVVGTGQMGSGIIQILLASGYTVNAYDAYKPAVDSLKDRLRKAYNKLAEKGKMDKDNVEKCLDRLTAFTELNQEACSVDMVIEAASEKVDLKMALFKQLDELCPPATILASNTSSISITTLATATKRPELVVGTHFFNPVPVMRLLEVITGLKTSGQTMAACMAVGEKLGKTVVEVKVDVPGFVVNRILNPMINEAAMLLQEGVASAEDIDKGMMTGANHPMGPLALCDLIGVDTVLAVMQVLYDEYQDPKYRPALIMKRMVSAGKLGRKAGEGFYKYN